AVAPGAAGAVAPVARAVREGVGILGGVAAEGVASVPPSARVAARRFVEGEVDGDAGHRGRPAVVEGAARPDSAVPAQSAPAAEGGAAARAIAADVAGGSAVGVTPAGPRAPAAPVGLIRLERADEGPRRGEDELPGAPGGRGADGSDRAV